MLDVQPVFLNSPADILVEFLVNQKLGVRAQQPPTDWQVECLEVGWMPPQPDNLIACSDTQGRNFGYIQLTGESIQQYGVQVRIRSVSGKYGNAKAFQIKNYLDAVYRDVVSIETGTFEGKVVRASYEIQSVIVKGQFSTGREKKVNGQDSNRSLFSINALMSVKLA